LERMTMAPMSARDHAYDKNQKINRILFRLTLRYPTINTVVS